MLDLIALGFLVICAVAVASGIIFTKKALEIAEKLVNNDGSKSSEELVAAPVTSSVDVKQKRQEEQIVAPEIDLERIFSKKPTGPVGGFGSRTNKSSEVPKQ